MSGSGSNIAHLSPEDISKWPTPNYENPDRLTWMPAYSSIWFIAATLLFGMRCWLRVRGHAGRLGLDDVRKHETDGRRRCAELTCTIGHSSTGLARWFVVHGSHDALLRMGWIPTCMGYSNPQANRPGFMHVAGRILVPGLRWMHKSVHSPILPPSRGRDVLSTIQMADLVCNRLYHCIHRGVLHHPPRQLHSY